MIVKNNHPVIVAEIANCHEGSVDYVIELIDRIKNANYDFIKFQIYQPDALVTKNHVKYESYVKKAFSKKEWKKIINYCEKNNISYIFDIFDCESFDFVYENFSPYGYKLHTTVTDNNRIIEKVNIAKKTLMISDQDWWNLVKK